MIILEEKIWEDYQKEIQKISARALGIAMTQDKVTKCKKAKSLIFHILLMKKNALVV